MSILSIAWTHQNEKKKENKEIKRQNMWCLRKGKKISEKRENELAVLSTLLLNHHMVLLNFQPSLCPLGFSLWHVYAKLVSLSICTPPVCVFAFSERWRRWRQIRSKEVNQCIPRVPLTFTSSRRLFPSLICFSPTASLFSHCLSVNLKPATPLNIIK